LRTTLEQEMLLKRIRKRLGIVSRGSYLREVVEIREDLERLEASIENPTEFRLDKPVVSHKRPYPPNCAASTLSNPREIFYEGGVVREGTNGWPAATRRFWGDRKK